MAGLGGGRLLWSSSLRYCALEVQNSRDCLQETLIRLPCGRRGGLATELGQWCTVEMYRYVCWGRGNMAQLPVDSSCSGKEPCLNPLLPHARLGEHLFISVGALSG